MGKERNHNTVNGTLTLETWEASRSLEYQEYRENWWNRPLSFEHGEVPLHLDIEATSKCNLKCKMCPRTVMVDADEFWKIEDFDHEQYKHIIDANVPLGLASVKFQYLGEPTLAKKLPEMIRYAKEAGVVDTMINTNGTTLNHSMSKQLIDSGLDKLLFSFDSPYKDVYNSIRINADYDTVLSNIKNFNELRNSLGLDTPFTRIQMVVFPETQQSEIDNFIELFRDIVDSVAICSYLPHTNLESKDKQSVASNVQWTCPQLFQRMFIHSDGVVTPCCNDAARVLNMGNIFKQSVKEIWNSDKYQKFRKLHIEGNGMKISPCNSCSLAKMSSELQNEQ